MSCSVANNACLCDRTGNAYRRVETGPESSQPDPWPFSAQRLLGVPYSTDPIQTHLGTNTDGPFHTPTRNRVRSPAPCYTHSLSETLCNYEYLGCLPSPQPFTATRYHCRNPPAIQLLCGEFGMGTKGLWGTKLEGHMEEGSSSPGSAKVSRGHGAQEQGKTKVSWLLFCYVLRRCPFPPVTIHHQPTVGPAFKI